MRARGRVHAGNATVGHQSVSLKVPAASDAIVAHKTPSVVALPLVCASPHSPSVPRRRRLHLPQRLLHVGLEQLHAPDAAQLDAVSLEETAGR